MYCFDPRHFGTTPYGSKKTGDYRAKFLLESVQDLKQNLKSIGSDLLIHMGRPEDALAGQDLCGHEISSTLNPVYLVCFVTSIVQAFMGNVFALQS